MISLCIVDRHLSGGLVPLCGTACYAEPNSCNITIHWACILNCPIACRASRLSVEVCDL